MEIQKITGIVLSSKQLGEADYVCSIYTKEYGKRDFIFKGLQKSKRRPQIVSEPGIIADIIYYYHQNKNSYIVNEYNILKDNSDIRDDLKKIYLLYFLVNLIEKTTGYNDKNKPVFDLLAAGIDYISKADYPEHFSVFFSLHLLKIHGILPDFHKCKICDQNENKDFYIDTSDFHPVCTRCVGSLNNKAILFNKIIKRYIHESLTRKFISIDHSTYPSNHIISLLFSITLFIENYYHVEIKPKELLIAELSC